MKLIGENNREFVIQNCKKPKFSDNNGKVWDAPTIFYINEIEINPLCDMAHGLRYYFEYNDRWYCGNSFDLGDIYFKEKLTLKRG